jgi:hypothetical protein
MHTIGMAVRHRYPRWPPAVLPAALGGLCHFCGGVGNLVRSVTGYVRLYNAVGHRLTERAPPPLPAVPPRVLCGAAHSLRILCCRG